MKKRTNFFKNLGYSLRMIHRYDKTYLGWEGFFRISLSALPFLLSWFSALFINKVTGGNFDSIFDPKLFIIIVIYISIPFLIEFLQLLTSRLNRKYFIYFRQWIDISFMDKKANIDIQTVENPGFNGLMSRVRENNWKLQNFVDWNFDALGFLVQLIIAVCVIASYQWWIAVILALALIPDMYAEIKYGRSVWGIWDAKVDVRRKFYEAQSHFDSVASLIEMKIFSTRSYFKRIIQSITGQFNDEIMEKENRKTKIKIWTLVLVSIVSASLVLFLMNDVIKGTLAVGTFIFILSSMNSFRSALSEFLRSVSNAIADSLFVDDIFKFLHTESIVKNGKTQLGPKTPAIEFKNVDFKYPDNTNKADGLLAEKTSEPKLIDPMNIKRANSASVEEKERKNIFTDLTFTIQPGEKIAIVGVNGAGKTTLTKLMMRFYDATAGEVLIGGQNIKELDLSTYYSKIGYLSQDYDRFRLPVKDAIMIGDTAAKYDLDKVIDAAKRAGAHEFIKEWPRGYETHLGKEFENGIEPSVGQWQKLALARLFYRDPQIWVLDEPTASIDSVAEMEVFQELERLPDDKTVILISHRFNTVKNADKIMVIEEGEIKEFGSHAELMAKQKGIYKQLFTLQKDSFEVV